MHPRNPLRAAALAALALLLGALPRAHAADPGIRPADTATTRVIPIAGDGFAGTSVNMVAGLQHSLFTHLGTQYAAFYAADATLVLARRPLGSDHWETHRTQYTGRVADAHNSPALVIDGTGVLHVAWDHHGNALNYARSTAPGSLELGPRSPMLDRDESSVTYPAFVRLRDGDLLFFYRDGRSGRGNLVLNRYTPATSAWTRVHDKLIDGEGARNAYPSVHYDARGTLHLAWVWRESPDVATNHDLAYARSTDAGLTWATATGAPLALPLTAATADYALLIPPGSSLMNPPTVSADSQGRPLIANYWAPAGTDIPQYHLVRHDGKAWSVQTITRRTTPFTLAGTATKRPPLSRAVLVSDRSSRAKSSAYLVFRDDERDGHAILASCPDIEAPAPAWTLADLTADSLGAWEPSLDPEQWRRMRQLHLLVQKVEQQDGNDHRPSDTPPTPVASLIWSPVLQSLALNRAALANAAPLPAPPAGALSRPLDPATILALLERATDWQLAAPYKRDLRGWEIAPFYIGALDVARLSASPRFNQALAAHFEKLEWKPAPRDYHADDYCVTQAYADLQRRTGDKRLMGPSLALFERLLAKPSPARLDWGTPAVLDRWSWCDALFMAPASWLDAHLLTGDPRFLEFANREWWATTDFLYIPSDGLFARDQSFLDLREPNGRRLYWSRGNGWVAAGLARVLARFPRDHADYPRYVALYRQMMAAALASQQPGGLWRPGLLDPAAHPAIEVSGSAFFTYALAWGINHKLLDRASAEPAVRRAWHALAACVREDGKVEHIQPIGASPEGFDPTHTDAFGVGAFLLAGAEVHALATGRPSPVYNTRSPSAASSP
jgi:rhamnogalacturonyl hydrolase YesR